MHKYDVHITNYNVYSINYKMNSTNHKMYARPPAPTHPYEDSTGHWRLLSTMDQVPLGHGPSWCLLKPAKVCIISE
jgi:hypothetical protein